ncbi:MAG: hypothetical protein IT450_09575 [Phycisphaerales bacterium]|nr:hypothetical protein [Phycisphaerales bacterium]
MRSAILVWGIGSLLMPLAQSALGDMVSFGVTRSGSSFRQSNLPGAPVYAFEPYTPLFLVHGGSNIHRGYMVFDLSAVPSGSTITSVHFEFYQQATGSPTVQILGGYQSGELAYDSYFPAASSFFREVAGDDTPFTSMTTDGSVFGQVSMSEGGNGSTQSVNLSSNGALTYFQSQIGSQVLLFTRLWDDLIGYNGQHGNDGGGYPTLRIEYDPVTVPAPDAGFLAALGLAGLALSRRRDIATPRARR